MDIHQIEAYLKSPDSQNRLKAIAELKHYDSEVAVPLLKSKMRDREFLVRSFVAMGLGKQQTADSFAALLELIKFDSDPNVRAEASNSLSLFGEVSASHLVLAFHRDDHWLVRRSILAALIEMNCLEELFDVCACGIKGEDLTVREASIEGFGLLAGSAKQDAALDQLLPLIKAEWWRIRLVVAKALGKFDAAQAREALIQLRQDEDHRVVGAALEGLV
ncbi:MAG: HEAT repeat domain-containing protein [Xenococcaceae cyanobacterium]